MTKLDEKAIIEVFQKKLGIKFSNEDVEQIKVSGNCIIKVDTLVESTDIPPKSPLLFAAKKSIVGPVSDFAAKGVLPQYGIISVNIPRRFTKKQVQDVATGIAVGAKEYGLKILGGDTNEGQELVLNVCISGTSERISKRIGAKVGDSIFVTGPFGYSSSGLEILLKKKKASQNFAKISKMAVLEPQAKLWFGSKCARYFSSSMDSSDGLSTTLHELARQSKFKFAIKKPPVNPDVLEFAKKNNLDWKNLVFHGGEEYEIVFTARQKDLARIKKIARSTQTQLIEIGTVEKGKGVTLQENEHTEKILDKGWSHLG
ncbi:MAG: thiamine-phosphate kinase [Nitrosopumilaceae archaeon]|nr:thiamine-phosphate kinase [Nitrosopumilaceae archaeon]NIU02364.1 thiamine-phosphate kinase [Nitrosopumilaceae archaeon]NIU88821.1 thiamine-phosphate kinase [Nitrosopumilaceae archaeon]NIV66946.1 thiamine-phosphate kinase [Nitrosopumilaceae archaeon]NIX62965.1 thiamine-phosphate kinase [Nitrosopumilaceae archaeon]